MEISLYCATNPQQIEVMEFASLGFRGDLIDIMRCTCMYVMAADAVLRRLHVFWLQQLLISYSNF